jgi:hypothetical protein
MNASLGTERTEPPLVSANAGFLAMLPNIHRQAGLALRHLRAEVRDELVAEIVARAFCAWRRLVAQGRPEIARPSPLVRYCLRQVLAGRRVVGRQNSQDLFAPQIRRAHAVRIERLDQRAARQGVIDGQVVEDRRVGPAATAAARLDLRAWLRTLSQRNRQIARALAWGETTNAVAQQFGLSAGRISQLRNALRAHWERFQGDEQAASCAG